MCTYPFFFGPQCREALLLGVLGCLFFTLRRSLHRAKMYMYTLALTWAYTQCYSISRSIARFSFPFLWGRPMWLNCKSIEFIMEWSRNEWTLSLVNDSGKTIYFIQESNWNIHRTTKTMTIVHDVCRAVRCVFSVSSVSSSDIFTLSKYFPFSRYTCSLLTLSFNSPVPSSSWTYSSEHIQYIYSRRIPHKILCTVFGWLWSPWTILQKLSCDAGCKAFGRFSVERNFMLRTEKAVSRCVRVYGISFFL